MVIYKIIHKKCSIFCRLCTNSYV